MKASTITTAVSLTLGLLGLACAGPAPPSAPQPKMRDAATHDQLVLALRKQSQNDPMKQMVPTKGEDPSVVNRPKDILSESDIICFGGLATLVPKRAILVQPAGMADRTAMKPGAKLVPWIDFYSRNRGWITTVEVSRVQAEGNEAINEDTRKQFTESGNLVVATYLGGPISVLPPKKPATNITQTP
jgi:hypothetical protein